MLDKSLSSTPIDCSESRGLELQYGGKQIECQHCGLPSANRFCCSGCESIFHTLTELGLLDFYQFRENGKHRGTIAAIPASAWEAFADVQSSGVGTTETFTFEIDGIHCAGCLWLLERLPEIHMGIEQSMLNMSAGELTVTYDSSKTSLIEIARLLTRLGYTPKNPTHTRTSDTSGSRDLLRIGVAGFAAMNTMMLAVSLFEGFYSGIDDTTAWTFRWVSFALATPTVLWAGIPLYEKALRAIRFGKIHIELPLTIAIFSGFILSGFNTIVGRPYVYFDSVVLLIFLLLLSRHLNARALADARRRSRLGWALLPLRVHVVEENEIVEKQIDDLAVGDSAIVWPGERFPADGTVSEGTSSIDCSILTGESRPSEIGPGAAVTGGSLNLSASITFTVASSGEDSRVGRLLRELRRSSTEKGSITKFTDMVGKYYILGLAGAVVLTLAAHMSSLSEAPVAVLTLLAVTCPCGLAFAVPTMYGFFLEAAAKRGLLVKSSAILENLPDVRKIIFDKTGTLTTGTFKLVGQTWYAASSAKTADILSTLTSATHHHPISKAIRDTFKLEGGQSERVRAYPGKGVECTQDGCTWKLGKPSWANPKGRLEYTNGLTAVVLSCDDRTVAEFEFGDTLRSTSKQALAALDTLGFSMEILSGDCSESVDDVVHQLYPLSVSYRSGLTPEEKQARLEDIPGPTIFVGDGINDVPALRSATIGIALAGGLEATVESASVVVTSGSIEKVVELIEAARRTRKMVYFSLCVSLAYNVSAGSYAILGQMNPLLAAFLMPTSSMVIMLIALLYRPFREN